MKGKLQDQGPVKAQNVPESGNPYIAKTLLKTFF
jgi:hypothetical protein